MRHESQFGITQKTGGNLRNIQKVVTLLGKTLK